MPSIGYALEEYEPIKDIKITCKECGVMLHDTGPFGPSIETGTYAGYLASAVARRHYLETKHADVDITVTGSSVREFDVTIGVGE